jgi:hypothetical protein
MIISLLIATAFIFISAAFIINFTQFFNIFSRIGGLAANFFKHMRFLINTLIRAYSRYQKLTNKPYLNSI